VSRRLTRSPITEWTCLVGGVIEHDPFRALGVWRLERYNDVAHLER
jgi:hypothetical protein